MMMIKIKLSSIIQFLIGLTLGLTLAALVAFNVVLVWVATGPRSLDKLTPYIEKALVGESDVRAEIGHTWLLWGGWQHPLDLRLKDVSLFTHEGKKFSSFPDISLGVDVLALPFGQVLPTSLSLTKPIISIKQNADKSLGFDGPDSTSSGTPEITSTEASLQALISSLIQPRSGSSLRKLSSIELLNADVTIGNEASGVILSAPDTTFVVRKESGSRVIVVLRSLVHYGETSSNILLRAAYNKRSKRLEGTISGDHLQPAILSHLFFDDPIVSALQLPVNAKVGFALGENGVLDKAQFTIDGGRGKILHPRIDGVLPVNRLKIAGKISESGKKIMIDKADIDFAGSLFSGIATINRAEKGLGITGKAAITDVDMSQAPAFWPLGLAPLSREWVTSNIRDGGITKASITLNIQPGDLDLPLLPKEAVDAQLELKDARIHYLDGHPEVRAVNALIKVDGISMDAAISHARAFDETTLSNGRLLIADLNPDNPLIEMSMHAEAPARDIVTLLGLPMLEHAEHLNLSPEKVSGHASGDAKLSFYFFAKDSEGKETPMTYEIDAMVDKVSSPEFLKRFDILGATGKMHVDDKEIRFSGAAQVNGATIHQGEISYLFTPKDGIDTRVDAHLNLDDAALKKFGVQLPIPIRDLPNMALELGLSTQHERTAIKTFTLKGEGVDIAGHAELTSDGRDMDSLALSKLHYDRTELSKLEYAAIDGGYRLEMAGNALDAKLLFDDPASTPPDQSAKTAETKEPPPAPKKQERHFSFEHFPRMDLTLDVGTLYVAENVVLSEVKGNLLCGTGRCLSANVSAMQGNKQRLVMSIRPEGRNRRISASADDAGAILRGLGVISSMEGGALSLSGIYDDVKAAGMLSGTLSINDYSLKQAPVLAKLLSLASLTGFFDTLSGNGISFKKMLVPYTLHQDVITVKDARTFGSAMGMTADGTITLPASNLQLEGTLVPSYTVNNVLGNVPLLGGILTGGEGEGVFAANYSMKGNSDDPEVMVNPLSILTPGFLRHLFDVF